MFDLYLFLVYEVESQKATIHFLVRFSIVLPFIVHQKLKFPVNLKLVFALCNESIVPRENPVLLWRGDFHSFAW